MDRLSHLMRQDVIDRANTYTGHEVRVNVAQNAEYGTTVFLIFVSIVALAFLYHAIKNRKL